VCGTGDSSSPSMAKAGMNTLMGMGVVFVTLIVISYVISLLRHIPGLIEKFKSPKTKSMEVSQAVDNVVSTIAEKEENLIDNDELTAVIMAAIAASEKGQVSAVDGLVVRSIRRKR
ncbi:MAG: OadG family protein, partial [Lachnospiraceae bacterium]